MTDPRVVSHEIVFEAFGVTLLVGVNDATDLDAVRELLPPGWRPSPASRPAKRFALIKGKDDRYECLRDDDTVTRGLSRELGLALLESQVRAYVALHAPEWIFVHAGVVAYGGKAVVLPGMSFAGKTTLVGELLRHGALYYSDEFAVLDQDGLVHPYPKPLSIRDASLRQVDHDVEALGGARGDGALRVGAIVATSYRPGATWELRRGSPGEGVMALLANTVAAQERPRRLCALLPRQQKVRSSFRESAGRPTLSRLRCSLISRDHSDRRLERRASRREPPETAAIVGASDASRSPSLR